MLDSPQLSLLFERVARFSKEMEFPKKTKVFQVGEIATEVFYVLSGTLKQSYQMGTKGFIFRLLAPGDFCESAYSLKYGKPGIDCLETITETKLLCINYEKLKNLMATDIKDSRIVREVIENYYLTLEFRLLNFLSKSPKERYDHLISEHSNLIGKFPDNVLASYLGMTKETFCRFRNKGLTLKS